MHRATRRKNNPPSDAEIEKDLRERRTDSRVPTSSVTGFAHPTPKQSALLTDLVMDADGDIGTKATA
jgi:hypothetical protein